MGRKTPWSPPPILSRCAENRKKTTAWWSLETMKGAAGAKCLNPKKIRWVGEVQIFFCFRDCLFFSLLSHRKARRVSALLGATQLVPRSSSHGRGAFRLKQLLLCLTTDTDSPRCCCWHRHLRVAGCSQWHSSGGTEECMCVTHRHSTALQAGRGLLGTELLWSGYRCHKLFC